MDSVEELLNQLALLQSLSPKEEAIARWLAEGLENAIIGYVSLGQTKNVGQMNRVSTFLDKLRALHRTFPSRDEIVDHLAAGLAWAIVGYSNIHSNEFESLLAEARQMYENRPERWLASQLALALFHSMVGYYNLNQSEKGDVVRAEMLTLAEVFPGLTRGRLV